MNAQELWKAVKKEFAEKVYPETSVIYKTFIDHLEPCMIRNHKLILISTSQLILEMVEREYLDILNDILVRKANSSLSIQVIMSIDELEVEEQTEKKDSYHITVSSFGYKYGLPIDADNIVDVRFLKNPFYINELREKTGQDAEVFDYVFSDSMTQEFYEKYKDLIVYMIDKYQYEGRDKVAIAIGCTGGKHRSVSIARKIHEDISKLGYKVYLEHRDIDKGR